MLPEVGWIKMSAEEREERSKMKIWKIVTGVLVFSQISLGVALAAAPSLDKIVKPSKGYVWRLDAANKLRLPRSGGG